MNSMMMVVIMLGLAIVVSVVAYGTYGKAIFSLFNGEKDSVARNSFGALTSATQTLLDNDVKKLTIRTPFQLSGNYCVVAFDKGFSKGKLTPSLKEAFMPGECHQQACMCLYINPKWGRQDKMEDGLIKCYTFDKNVIFYSEDVPGYEEDTIKNRIGGTPKNMKDVENIPERENYENFVVFGEKHKNVEGFGLHDLWLEKRVVNNKNYIYISIYNQENKEKRS